MPDPPASAPAAPSWRLLGVERDEPVALLERGAALLDALGPGDAPLLRWYVPATPAIVLGRGQRDEEAAGPLPVVRRHTGGGAVLMDADLLSLDVLLPVGHPWLGDDLGAVFRRVGRAWAAALADLGLEGLAVHEGASQARRLGGERERLLAAICYALPGRGEVLHEGRKLVGLSQRRRRHGALVQCGMLWRWRPGPLLAALGADPRDEDLAHRAVGLHELLPAAPAEHEVIAAVERRMSQTTDG